MAPSRHVDLNRQGAVATVLIRRPEVLIRQITAGSAGIDEYASALIARVRSSDEGREGIRAILEQRKPRWVAEEHV
ncbi:MAG: hypothetical protein HY723_03820 [Chloroflexi bacterium]|nr:hypothetical protein [Chloroflexota bacterium]